MFKKVTKIRKNLQKTIDFLKNTHYNSIVVVQSGVKNHQSASKWCEKEVKIVFLGNFQHNIDKKGRVFIPSKFREELGEEFIISQDISGKRCLCVYSLPEWDKFVEKIDSLPNTKSSVVKRFLFANAFTVGFDAQGRILVPSNLREYALLEEKADILGVNNKVEIWNTALWAEETKNSTPESIAEIMAELDF